MIYAAILAPLVFTLLFLHASPLLPHTNRLFGVAVPGEIRRGAEGRALLRGYTLQLLPWSIASVLIALGAPPLPGSLLSATVPLIAASVLFFRFRTRALRYALPASTILEVSLAEDDDNPGRRLAWLVPPFAMLAATAMHLRANWYRLPDPFPIHYGGDGKPNGWAHRTPLSVYGGLIIGALVLLLLAGILIGTYYGARRGRMRSTTATVLTTVAYLMGGLFTFIGLSPLYPPPGWAFIIPVLAIPVVLIFLLARAAAQPEPEGAPSSDTPESCWHGDLYYNPADPALFVEKRFGIGYTLNFAHRGSWFMMGGIVVFIGLTIFIAIRIGSH